MKLLSAALLSLSVQLSAALEGQPQIRATSATQAAMPWLSSVANDVDFVKATANLSGSKITGRSVLGIETFAGLPYAAPPLGKLRLRPPQDFTGSLDNFDASGLAPACPQIYVGSDTKDILFRLFGTVLDLPLPILTDITQGQEDCLTLTVQRPAGTKPGDKLPVLFWMFGGGFQLGGSNTYDGTTLIAQAQLTNQPFVFVAINYRVNAFGYLGGADLVKEGSANLGSQDQRKALEWVSDNIAAFGGDPDKVTIWGESAGSVSVLNHMIMYGGNATYKGKSLFHGGIMNSGSVVPMEPADGQRAQSIYDDVVLRSGCAGASDKLDCLRGVSKDTLLNAAKAQANLFSPNNVTLPWWTRPDGNLFTDSAEVLVSQGKFHKVPVIIGSQEDEGSLFGVLTPNINTESKIVDFMQSNFYRAASRSDVQNLVNQYPADPAAGSPYRTGLLYELHPGFKRISSLIGDMILTMQRRLTLQKFQDVAPDMPTWSYLSSYFHLLPVLGTCHASDLVQIFYGLPPNDASFTNRQFYYNFIHNQDPNKGVKVDLYWPQWKENKAMMWFKALSHSITKDDFRQNAGNYLKNNWSLYKF